MVTKKNFRFDIQTLRALAVIVVLLYHFKFEKIQGGFVGVDVFFVISGYLISKSILKNQVKGMFSFADFYFKRIKRLYPALLVTIFITYIVAYFLLFPSDFEAFSASAIFASVGLSNIYYWLTNDYFNNFTGSNPLLLHTWSLSVEFQFYLIWPLILLLIARHKLWQLPVTIIVTLASALLAVLYIQYDSSGAFYLTPFRIHEFSIGAVIFLLEDRIKFSKFINTAIVTIGYIFIFIAITTFNSSKITFPGIYAWLPVVGSGLIIFAGANTHLSKVLNFKPFVFIGEISYSLYLVHWPLFVFLTHSTFNYTSNLRNSLIIYSFISAIALYYLVEKPFRNNIKNISPVKYTIWCQFFVLVIITFSISSVIGKGWVWRLPEGAQTINRFDLKGMHQYTFSHETLYADKTQFDTSDKPKILIIGDSQAADVVNMLHESKHANSLDIIYRRFQAECALPYINEVDKAQFYKDNVYFIRRPEIIAECEIASNNLISNPELLSEADKIIIAFGWNNFIAPYLKTALDKMSELAGNETNKTYLVGLKFFSKTGVEIFDLYHTTIKDENISLGSFAEQFIVPENRNVTDTLKNYPNSRYISLYDIFCNKNKECKVLTDNNSIILYDLTHFTPDGAGYIGDAFYNALMEEKK